MVVRNAEVVNLFPLAGVEEFIDGRFAAVVADQDIARLKVARFDPAAVLHVEGMFARCADDLAANVQMQDKRFAD